MNWVAFSVVEVLVFIMTVWRFGWKVIFVMDRCFLVFSFGVERIMAGCMGPGWLTPSETRREYFPVDSSPTSLLVKVSEGVNHPGPGYGVHNFGIQPGVFALNPVEIGRSNC